MDENLIKALQNPKIYNHEVQGFKLLQTHISWVLLTGPFAYKIKKPVNFGFCDFSSLEKRKHFCELEVKLNKQLAPDIYIHVVAITGTPDKLEIDGEGPVLDYAIKMHQFDQSRLLSNVHQEEGLSKALMHSLATQVADFHQKAPKVEPDSSFGTLDHIFEPVLDNFRTLNQLDVSRPYSEQVETIALWAKETFERLTPVIGSRKEKGFVIAGHGDIHLGNIVLLKGTPVIFDCIEFNDEFRHLDTISDIGFLAMDLESKRYDNLAHYLCNQYFERTGDYEGVTLLAFYKSYRAMVRAKVMALTMQGMEGDSPEKQAMLKEMVGYIELAQKYCEPSTPSLSITFGPSGSGKSHHTESLLIKEKAFRLRSDVIRKQLCGLNPYESCPQDKKASVYSDETTQKVYESLLAQAQMLLKENCPVIIDATNLRQSQREPFIKLAQTLKVPFKILAFEQDAQILKTRLQQRKQNEKTSDADQTVLEKQLSWLEPLTDEEKSFTQSVS